MVLDKAERLYDKMVKELVTTIMGDITSANGTSSQPPSAFRDISI